MDIAKPLCVGEMDARKTASGMGNIVFWLVKRFLSLKCTYILVVVSLVSLAAYTLAGPFSATTQHNPLPSVAEDELIYSDVKSDAVVLNSDVKTIDVIPPEPPMITPSYLPKRQCSNASNAPHTNIVFIKVHKAGSSTVSNLLARYALNHNLNIVLPEQKPVGWVFHCFGPFHEYRVLPQAPGQPFHVLFNHMFYNRTALNNVMPKDTFYVAIMREPEQRFLSGAYYFKVLKSPARNNTDNAAFKKFLSEPKKSNLEKNFRIFNSVAWNTGLPLAEQKKVESVKRHLQKLDREIDLMMVMERFPESLVLFKRRACLSLRDIVYAKINTRKTYNTHTITSEDRKKLRDWQRADHMAYDHFMLKFEQQVREEGPSFQREVSHFKSVMEKVTKYCSSQSPKWEVLVVGPSEWNDEFSLNEKDCQMMVSDERELQKLLLTRARERRERLGYKETRKVIPNWQSDC